MKNHRPLRRRTSFRSGEVRNPLSYVALALVAVLLIGGLILLYVMQGEELANRYGVASGHEGGVSVNGVGILAGLMREAGHRVTAWPKLSPALAERADTIVWFPSDLQKPPPEVVEWLENWLLDGDGRTLIFVCRDFDAEPGYWMKVSPGVPAPLASEFALRQSKATGDFAIARQPLPATEDWGWFTMQGTLDFRQVTTLAGVPRWTAGVEAAQSEIELHGRIVPPTDREEGEVQVLLESEGDALVWSEDFVGSQLLVVANGSFLLNLQLVNHEHRKLAAALVREIGPPKQHVVFLEATGAPDVSDKDPEARPPSALQLLSIAPFDRILLHLAVLGIIFCFARWPIFGRPREEPAAPLSDFGEHVSSLGELLSLAGNRAQALTRLQHYQQLQIPNSKLQISNKSQIPNSNEGNDLTV